MNCPACSQALEMLLWPHNLQPCGTYGCKECRYPDNRWVKLGNKMYRYVVQLDTLK